MIKAQQGRKVFYIYAKSETRKMPNGISDAVKQVAEITHERIDKFDVLDASLRGKTADGLRQFDIGKYGKYFAITRTRR